MKSQKPRPPVILFSDSKIQFEAKSNWTKHHAVVNVLTRASACRLYLCLQRVRVERGCGFAAPPHDTSHRQNINWQQFKVWTQVDFSWTGSIPHTVRKNQYTKWHYVTLLFKNNFYCIQSTGYSVKHVTNTGHDAGQAMSSTVANVSCHIIGKKNNNNRKTTCTVQYETFHVSRPGFV